MRVIGFRRLAAASVALLLLLVGVGAAAAAKPKPKPKPAKAAKAVADSLLVKYAVDTPVLLPGDRVLGKTLTGVDVVSVKGAGSLALTAARYAKLPGVVYAEPNSLARSAALAAPNDPKFSTDWAWQTIGAVAGWSAYPGSYATSGAATIAIVDTGVDSSHPDLSDGRVLTAAGANCVNSAGTCASGSALDDNGHGTHVAGIAAAATNNGVGVAGTAFDAQVIPVKVLDSTGTGSYAAITDGIVWAAQHGARAINLSIEGSAYSQTLCDAVKLAISSGAVVVAAAGNNGTSAPSYPAACSGAIGVSATDSADTLASFSDYGKPDVFVSAPGVSIYSTYLRGGYATMSGTSMAAPFVTGLAAQLLGQLPARTPQDVATILAETSDKVGSGYGADPYGTCAGCTWSSSFGYGRIDMANALGLTDFALTASPSSTQIAQAGSGDYTISATPVNGFAGTITYTAQTPVGMLAHFSPPTSGAPGSTQLHVTVTPAVAPGTYAVKVTGTAGSLEHTITVDVVVTPLSVGVGATVPGLPRGDFALTVAPGGARVAPLGAPVPFAIALTASSPVVVDLSLSGVPAGATALLTPTSTSAPGAATLTFFAGPTVPAGSYTITVTATSGSYSHSASVTVNVLQSKP